MFVGVGASRVRDLFEQAKRNSPCIIFIDEIDAVGRQRGAGLGGSHDEREQTLNQILVEMDGFDTDTNVILIAATNRPDILDPALLRPGRFDRQVVMDRPDKQGPRGRSSRCTCAASRWSRTSTWRRSPAGTPGFVGADLENLVNEAAILAARRNKRIDRHDRVPGGRRAGDRRPRAQEPHHRRAARSRSSPTTRPGTPWSCRCCRTPTRCTRSRSSAAAWPCGYTMPLPEEDRLLSSRDKLRDELAGLLGGRVAEEMVFGDVTTGASNDLERVTTVARRMVTQYGMSDVLGPQTFGEKEEMVFLGREIGEQRNYSEEVAEAIDRRGAPPGRRGAQRGPRRSSTTLPREARPGCRRLMDKRNDRRRRVPGHVHDRTGSRPQRRLPTSAQP